MVGSNIVYGDVPSDDSDYPAYILHIEDAEDVLENRNYKVRDMYFTGSEGFVNWTHSITNLKPKGQTRGHCIASDMELLTYEGWKNHDQIDENSLVMTLNREEGRLEWNRVLNKWIYDNYDEHVKIKTANLDLSVTKDHNMIHLRRANKGGFLYGQQFARNLTKRRSFYIQQAGELIEDNVTKTSLSDAEYALLGAFIAEGGLVSKKGKEPYAFRLYQHMKKRKWIEDILNNLNYKFHVYVGKNIGRKTTFSYGNNYHIGDDTAVFYIPSKYAWRLLSITTQKRIPLTVMWSMDKRQFDILLESLIQGDGHKENKYAWVYYTKDKILADQIQILCITHGYRARISTRIRAGRTTQYEVRIFRDRYYSKVDQGTQPNAVKLEKYNGKSWCVSVRNHTIMVRRNGKVAIIGNSHPDAVEKCHVLAGDAFIYLDGVSWRVKAGTYIMIGKTVHHKVVNASETQECVFTSDFPGHLVREGHIRKKR